MNQYYNEMKELLEIWNQSRKEKDDQVSHMLVVLVNSMETFCSSYRELVSLGKKCEMLSRKIKYDVPDECDKEDCDDDADV